MQPQRNGAALASGNRSMSRRHWLHRAAMVAGAGLLAACAPAAPAAAPTAAPAAPTTGAAAAKPTAAPAVAAASPAPAATAAPAAAAKPPQPATITMWGNHPEWKDSLAKITAAFSAATPGVTVELDFKPGPDYPAALSTALAGGEAPDLIGFLPGTSVAEAAKSGQIADLTGKVPVDNLIVAAANQVQLDGKVYGAPLAAYTVGVFYQRPMFQKYGLAAPKTWQELLDTSKKLKDAGVVPMEMPGKDGILPYFFYHMAVSSILGESGFKDLISGKVKLTDDNLVPAAKLLTDMQPYYNNGFESVSYTEGKAEFANGRAAMIIGGSADYTGYKQVNPSVDVGVFGFPPPQPGKAVTVTGMELIYTVNAKSKAQDAATAFVAWLATKEAQQLVANTIAQPVVKGVASTEDRVAKEMVDAGQANVPVWLDVPQASAVLDIFQKEGGGIFNGRLSPADLAKTLQGGIKS